MPELNSVTDPNLPEPKGVASASANEVYVADGSGSGDWSPIELIINAAVPDLSSASTTYVAIPYAGSIAKIIGVLGGAISGSNATVTVRNSAGVSMGTITVTHSGSAAGDIDTLTPASNNTVSADSFISVETNGASTGHSPLHLSIILERS